MRKICLSIGVLFLVSVQSVFAATNSFTVRALIGDDTTPPTTPTLLSATPASASQIDIVWSVATDNFALGGYQVFRDSVQIATTTLTSYSDSGLSSSTLYTYSVRAFDTSYNYSSTSNTLATTTFAPVVPPVEEEEESSQSSSKALTLTEFSIVPSTHSALFSWKTSSFSKFDLRWGRTAAYELGFVSHDLLKKEHKTSIGDLEPGTVYEYELFGYSRSGKLISLKKGQFTTVSAPDTQAPPNVQNLTAYVIGNDVHLSWKNPVTADFSKVRILRSHLFFPVRQSDGFLPYEGGGESFIDKSALAAFPLQYYTVFTIDNEGNTSSGAVIAVAASGHIQPIVVKDIVVDSPYKIRFEDFEFIQEEQIIGNKGLKSSAPYLVRIAYNKLPEHLKTITMTFFNPIDGTERSSYLLRINNDKTYYEAFLPPRESIGEATVRFSVYDFEAKTIQTVDGSVPFYQSFIDNGVHFAFPFETTLAISYEVATFSFFIFVLIVMLLAYRFIMLFRRR